MRQKLALTIALAGFAAITALGVGMAGADPSAGLGEEQAASGLTTTPSLAPPAASAPVEEPACSNEVDDDEDGLVDLEDPDCDSPDGTSEEAEEGPSGEAAAPPAAGEGEGEPAGEGAGAPAAAGGVKSGAGLAAGEAADEPSAAPKRNQSLGGGTANGGVGAPPATAGAQPPAGGDDGGSQFGAGGAPTAANANATIATFGPAPIGVPNFVIDSFEIPPFLLPIYQACGTEYGIPWEVLAAINKIETAFGTNLNVSSAGAVGWMQFLPSTWETYGVDANGDGRKDPYNPVDAICAAARYLKASGGAGDLYNAILAYNHADWYAQEVLLYARAYGKLPTDLVGSLTGLTEGAHFPVAADARYADEISARAALSRATPRQRDEYGNAAEVISSSPTRRGINIYARRGAPVVAVNDGVIVKMGDSKRLDRYVILRDAYGNRYTYAALGAIVRKHRRVITPTGKRRRVPVDSQNIRPRVYALPGRTRGGRQAGAAVDRVAARDADGTLKVGSRVIAGTELGTIGRSEGGVDPHVNFAIRPAGKGAPRIDPKPILDGWKLLEATAIYRAKGKNPFTAELSGAGVLLLSEGGAGAPRARRPPPRHLRLRPHRHRHRQDRPPRAGGARVPGLERVRALGQRARVRPQLPDHARATSPSTRPATRSTSRRSTACR